MGAEDGETARSVARGVRISRKRTTGDWSFSTPTPGPASHSLGNFPSENPSVFSSSLFQTLPLSVSLSLSLPIRESLEFPLREQVSSLHLRPVCVHVLSGVEETSLFS